MDDFSTLKHRFSLTLKTLSICSISIFIFYIFADKITFDCSRPSGWWEIQYYARHRLLYWLVGTVQFSSSSSVDQRRYSVVDCWIMMMMIDVIDCWELAYHWNRNNVNKSKDNPLNWLFPLLSIHRSNNKLITTDNGTTTTSTECIGFYKRYRICNDQVSKAVA